MLETEPEFLVRVWGGFGLGFRERRRRDACGKAYIPAGAKLCAKAC